MTTDTLEKPAIAQEPVGMDIWHEISQTLYREARMLEDEQYRDWIANFVHPDILYQVAEKQSRMRRDRYSGTDIVFSWNDGLADIEMRLRAMESGMQWSSNPVEATRRNISNVEVYQGEDASSFVVYANLWSVRKGSRNALLPRWKRLGSRGRHAPWSMGLGERSLPSGVDPAQCRSFTSAAVLVSSSSSTISLV